EHSYHRAKTASPKRLRQNGFAKTASPKRLRQNDLLQSIATQPISTFVTASL
ncbi:hypothetical protein BgiMline_028852, partial [Biomphalaria glabrata]